MEEKYDARCAGGNSPASGVRFVLEVERRSCKPFHGVRGDLISPRILPQFLSKIF